MEKRGSVRLIGGQWRGRKLQVLDLDTLRPTPDRVRETVFNWLMPIIPGACCLDLFAGSGALGFEALSRGAAFVVLIDQSKAIVTLLKEELARFKASNAEIYQANAPEGIKTGRQFDVVFLDPPFQQQSLMKCCFYLEEHDLLAKEAYIYLEASEALDEKALPPGWRLLKQKQAGSVFYHLAQRIQS